MIPSARKPAMTAAVKIASGSEIDRASVKAVWSCCEPANLTEQAHQKIQTLRSVSRSGKVCPESSNNDSPSHGG